MRVRCDHAMLFPMCDIQGDVCQHAEPHDPIFVEWQGRQCTELTPCGDEENVLVQCVEAKGAD